MGYVHILGLDQTQAFDNGLDLINIDIPYLRYNPLADIRTSIVGIVINGGILWFLYKLEIRSEFSMSQEWANKLIIASFSIGLLMYGTVMWVLG